VQASRIHNQTLSSSYLPNPPSLSPRCAHTGRAPAASLPAAFGLLTPRAAAATPRPSCACVDALPPPARSLPVLAWERRRLLARWSFTQLGAAGEKGGENINQYFKILFSKYCFNILKYYFKNINSIFLKY